MNKKHNKKLYYILLFLVSTTLAHFLIYTHDDWAWGSSVGINRLNKLFDNYNGRYLGNLIVLVLTRSYVLKTIVVGSITSLIIIVLQRIINKNNTNILLISIILFFCMPKAIFKESIAWISGFSNYAISSLLLLIYYLNIEKIQDNKSKIVNVLLLLLGFSVSLLMENITIYNLLLSIFMIVYFKYKDKSKKINIANIFYLIGSLAGTILMFTNSVYYNISKGEDFYREISTDNFLIKALYNANSILKHTFTRNGIMISLISVLLLKIIYDNKDKLKNKYIFQFLTSYIFIYPIYCLLRSNSPTFAIFSTHTDIMDFLLASIYSLIVLFITIKLIFNKELKKRLLFYLGSIVILIGPLLFVTPIGPRCFLIIYLLMALYTLDIYNYLISDKIKETFNKYILLIIVLAFVYLFEIYIHIYVENKNRHKFIEERVLAGDKFIYLTPLPHEDYTWFSSPVNDHFREVFKLYYDLDDDITIIVNEEKKVGVNYE